ncbi:MAG TPA: CDP-alcohol phosphatidyltransferase family protein [Gammaproteobacteria bacterium]|nr:CDP-alcohol phosphatidyltransferase family protein [Gammaproteobacteria bacterium]
MSIYQLKPAFQALLRPIVGFLVQCKFTPNVITVIALLSSIIVGAWIATDADNPAVLFLLPLFLFIRMALNAIDGMMAREYNMCTDLGVYLNELGDMIADTALYLPLALVPGFSPLLMVLIIMLALLSETAGIIATQIGHERRYDGPFGKSDRAFALGVIALLLAFGVALAPFLVFIQWFMIALLVLTLYNRIHHGLKG